jgi:MoaA/NifB/PqqE/SkfB family radical SAM enzyme
LSTYCPLPWIHLGTHPHGGVTPCCISDHTDGKNRARNFINGGEYFLNLNENTIEDHMNSDYFKGFRLQFLAGEKPAVCKRCFDDEAAGRQSKRLYESEVFKAASEEYARSITSYDGTIQTDLRFVELRLGNVCNVKCVTCNPASSSRWVSDYKNIVNKLKFVNSGYLSLDQSKDFNWAEDPKFYDELFKCSPNLELLYINGGEPTLIEAHWNFIRKLVETGRSKNIIIWYNINMTNLPDFAIPLWKEFKEARICPSIDCLDHRNTYIRYPTNWETVKINLNKLLSSGLNVRITQTVSAYNYIYVSEFLKWTPCPVDINIVYDPSYLSPAVLPPEILLHVKNSLDGNSPQQLINLVQTFSNNNHDLNKWKEFCKYNDTMDEIRKTNWRKTFSELIKLMDEYGIQHRY